MTASDDVKAWVKFAKEDYAMASLSLRRKAPLTNGACFHSQQCVEKYLKAILVHQHQPFPRTHDLRLLSNLCTTAGVFLEINNDILDLLSFLRLYAPVIQATFRHSQEARDALRITRLRRFVRKWLGIL